MVGLLAAKAHKTMHKVQTDEIMVPIFTKDADGGAAKSKYVMGRRNYCIMERDTANGDLICDIRVEIEKGRGKTTGCVICLLQMPINSDPMLYRSYSIRAPAPIWEGGPVPEM